MHTLMVSLLLLSGLSVYILHFVLLGFIQSSSQQIMVALFLSYSNFFFFFFCSNFLCIDLPYYMGYSAIVFKYSFLIPHFGVKRFSISHFCWLVLRLVSFIRLMKYFLWTGFNSLKCFTSFIEIILQFSCSTVLIEWCFIICFHLAFLR